MRTYEEYRALVEHSLSPMLESLGDIPDRLLEAVKLGVLTREEMETAARNILRLILRID